MGLSGPAIVCQGIDQGVRVDEIACHRVAGIVLYEVVASGGQNDCACPMVAGIPLIPGDDRVGQCQAGCGCIEGTDEDCGRRPVWPDVIGDRGIENLHGTVGMEDCAAMPAGGPIAADRAVGDRHVAQ